MQSEAGGTVGFQLSPQQRRLAQLTARGFTARTVLGIQVAGGVNLSRLESAFNTAVEEFEILRTNIVTARGLQASLQLIARSSSSLHQSGRFVGSIKRAFARYARATEPWAASQELQRPIRSWLAPLGDGTSLWLLDFGPARLDRRSLDTFIHRVAAQYLILSGSQAADPGFVQYADYAQWIHELRGNDSELITVREITDSQDKEGVFFRPLRDVGEFRLRSFDISLNHIVPQFSRTVHRLAISPQAALLACWHSVIQSLTNQPISIVGVTFSGRTDVKLNDSIGLFERIIVMTMKQRATLSTLPEIAQRVQLDIRQIELREDNYQEMQEHYATFGFDAILSNPDPVSEGLQFALSDTWVSHEPFQLRLLVDYSDRHLTLHFQYDSRRVSRREVHFWAESFTCRLAAMVEVPSEGAFNRRSVAQIPDNSRLTSGMAHLRLDAEIERQAVLNPDGWAVVIGSNITTYKNLFDRVNALEFYLSSKVASIRPLIAILATPSLGTLVGMISVWRLGLSWVPLEPTMPMERLKTIIQAAGCDILLVDGLSPAFNSLSDIARIVDVQCAGESAQIARIPSGFPRSLGDVAYVIFTSGSSGEPKGVTIEHSQLASYIDSICSIMPDRARLAWGVVTSLAADLAYTAVFSALRQGGCVHLVDGLLEGRSFWDHIQNSRIQALKITPSHLRVLLEGAYSEDLAPLRVMVVGGETFPRSLADKLQYLAPHIHIVNHYGPTETTIGALTFPVPSLQFAAWHLSVPIGRPIANTSCYILDAHLCPVPVGVAGELYIGGAGVARGYLNRPDLTAERFIADPFVPEGGGRLYRTGDLARYLPDGNIEFLGRLDNQVKVRGFRIELGEIEAVLGQHADVRESLVVAWEDETGDKRLAAYLVPELGRSVTSSVLRRFLQEKLPEYMIPSVFMQLEAFPLTPNGKLDRRALPQPEPSRAGVETLYVAPRNLSEELLAGIWLDVLRLAGVGVHDNFFEIGGHSLLATRVISRVRNAFAIEVPLRDLFECPTIAGLAERIEQLRHDGSMQLAPAIEPAARDAPLPLSFAQQRLWFLDQLEGGSPAYNMPAALHLMGGIDIGALEQALNEVVRRHESLRTNFCAVNGEPIQVIAPVSEMKISILDLSSLPPDDRLPNARQLAADEARRPFALDRDPLLRVSLLRLSPEEHVLLATMHHIVSDGWSVGIFVRELGSLYEAYAAGKPSPLAPLPVQYADFASWQRRWLSGDVLQTQLAYWRKQLAGIPALLELPTDHPRPAVRSSRGATHSFVLPEELTVKLRALAQHENATLFMTLLAAFKVLLHRYSGQQDIVVGAPIANRHRGEIEPLIGFFVNSIALRTDLSDDPSFRALIARVRTIALDAYDHQDVPFEQLVEALNPERDLSHTPVFQVMFDLRRRTSRSPMLPGLSVKGLDQPGTTAKFDMSLSLDESATGITGTWEYSTELFEEATVQRMLQHFQVLLESAASNPEQRISTLPLLSEAERHQILVSWNDTQADYPEDRCIHQLFADQAQRTPEATAAVFEEHSLSYRDLDDRSNQLAHYLRGLGVGPEVLVGICVERSLEMVIGLLGILKAGGAYVPLDPDYPKDRIGFMLDDTRVPVLLTLDRLLGRLPPANAQIVRLDLDWQLIAQQPATAPHNLATPQNLAYVIYTSGSTGTPKGVCITHDAICNQMSWRIGIFDKKKSHSILIQKQRLALMSPDGKDSLPSS